nr:restriction endonuclease subunit S [Glaesserella parasuis]
MNVLSQKQVFTQIVGEARLRDIAITVTSGSRNWAQYYSDTGAKFIRMTNLNRNGITLLLDDLKFVNIQSNSADGKRTSLQANDILISITTELGKIGFIPENFGEAYINQHTALIRIDPNKAHAKFIAYVLSSATMNKTINSLNDAGAKAGLNLPTIKALSLKLPSIEEQIQIAETLSTWDNAIQTTEKLLENSRQQKKALMQRLL